jgi:twitching motility protein PilT
MKKQPVTRELLPKVVAAMAKNAFFQGMDQNQLGSVAQLGSLVHYAAGETVARQSEPAATFGVVLNGRVRESIQIAGLERPIEVQRASNGATYGLVEACCRRPMRGLISAGEQVLALELPAAQFDRVLAQSAALTAQVVAVLANRLADTEAEIPLVAYEMSRSGKPNKETMALLPVSFVTSNRVLPVRVAGEKILVGFVDELTPTLLQLTASQLAPQQVQPVRITSMEFGAATEGFGAAAVGSPFGAELSIGSVAPPAHAPTMGAMSGTGAVPLVVAPSIGQAPIEQEVGLVPPTRQFGARTENNPKLDALLRRMVAEGASDLHLSAMHKPRWRIDGEIREISEARELGQLTVLELFEPIMSERQLRELRGKGEGHDVDFAYALLGVARFRVNLFADRMGISGVLRTIPDKILTFEQLGLPKTVAKLCDHPKGMVLVTGPTGSGKSTTLAAMIDYINKSKRTHIITMEDPIEFVHKSRKALINQREIGVHSEGFKRALKSALRQDPDIVLVGELRDIETVALAVETANTGHLVFGTLHTATAVSTVERIVDLFPPEQQGAVRAGVAEALKGVIAQTLLRKKGGGRMAALEIMVGSAAISNLIREGKMHHIANIMLTAKKHGNQMLNEEMEKLVRDGKVTYEEALSKAIDKPELAKRFGREYFEE